MLCIVFDGFIGSGMVENLYLDTKMLTLSALLREIEPFSCIELGQFWPGSHLGRHLEYFKMLNIYFYPPDGK